MIELTSWQWVAAAIAAVMIGVSKTGLSGLGMLYVAVFALILPSTRQSTGIVLPLLLIGDLIAVFAYRRHAQWRYLVRVFPWAAVGIVVGYFALGRIDDRQTKVMVGVIVLAMVALHLWRQRRSAKGDGEERAGWFAPIMGVLAGFTTLVANGAGPLMTIYLLAMRLPKLEFMGTGAVFFLLINSFKVPFVANLGLIAGPSLRFDLYLCPAVIAGALFGRWLLPRVDQKLFEALALALSAAAGLKLLF